MPVEPVGLVLSAVGLISLFTACLDLLDAISSLKTCGAVYQDLTCMLEVEKVLLLKWGEAAGLLQSPNSTTTQRYSKHLEDERILSSVAQTLGCLKRKFENANNLATKYGLRRQTTGEALCTYPDHGSHPTLDTLQAKQEWTLKRVQSETSFTMKARWAIHDRAKLSDLTDEITKLNENLHRLVPIVGSIEVEHRYQGKVANDPYLERHVILTRVPGQHLILDVISTCSWDPSEGSAGGIQIHKSIYEWLERVTSDLDDTADQHSCREFLSVKTSIRTTSSEGKEDFFNHQETQSISMESRIGSSSSSYSSGYNRLEQNIQRRMDRMYFVFLVYAIVSFIATISVIVAVTPY